MHFYCGFCNADIVGSLFVKATGHDMEHDFTLAGTKTFETLLQPSQSSITLPSSAIASKSGLDGLNEVLISKRFSQKLYGATFHRLHGHRDVGVRCDEDDRHLPVRRGKVTLKFKPASSWQSHVEYQTGRAVRRCAAAKKSETEENSRVCRPTVRNKRPTELRNSGSSSTISTLEFSSTIRDPAQKAPRLPIRIVFILRTIRRHG